MSQSIAEKIALYNNVYEDRAAQKKPIIPVSREDVGNAVGAVGDAAGTAASALNTPTGAGLSGAGAGALLGATMGNKKNRGRNALLGAGLGGGAGLLAQHLMNQKAAAEKQANPLMAGLGSLGNAASGLMSQIPDKARTGAMYGGLGGAALGGLSGLIAPGHEDSFDAYGNPVRKRRGRLGAALRGALGGGLVGAGVGGAANQFIPDEIKQRALSSAQGYGSQLARALGYRGKSETAQTPTTSAAPYTQAEPSVSNPLYRPFTEANRDGMKARPDATYSPTDEAAAAHRHKMEALQAEVAENQARRMQITPETIGGARYRRPAKPQFQSDFDKLPPAQQEAMLQEAGRKFHQQYVDSLPAPTTNRDARGIDMSGLNNAATSSPTLGR